jgi:LPXTG-motif cell wall-anchored protein
MVVSRTAIESGGSFNVQGCASPRSQVTFTLFSHPAVLGTTVADNSGFYRATLSIPCDMEPGRHTLQTSGGAIEAATLEVTGATASACPAIQGQERARAAADQDLPRTGSSSVVPWVMVGAGLVAFGVVAVIVARRRRLHADL